MDGRSAYVTDAEQAQKLLDVLHFVIVHNGQPLISLFEAKGSGDHELSITAHDARFDPDAALISDRHLNAPGERPSPTCPFRSKSNVG